MKTPLWIPSEQRKQQANITRFMDTVSARRNLNLRSYAELYQWSVENISDFWAAVWEFSEIKASKPYDQVVEDLTKFPGAKWFPGARVNYAQHLLAPGHDSAVAVHAAGERVPLHSITRGDVPSGAVDASAPSRRNRAGADERPIAVATTNPGWPLRRLALE